MTIDWPQLALIIVLTLAVVFTVAFVGYLSAYVGIVSGARAVKEWLASKEE